MTTILQAVITALVWKTTETCHNFVEFVGSGETLGSFTIVQTDFALCTVCCFRIFVAAYVWRRMKIDVVFVQDARKWKQLLGCADVVSLYGTTIHQSAPAESLIPVLARSTIDTLEHPFSSSNTTHTRIRIYLVFKKRELFSTHHCLPYGASTNRVCSFPKT